MRWLKRLLLLAFGLFWLGLAFSDFAVLAGRKTMHYSTAYEVRCRYWTGRGRLRIWHRGIPETEHFECPSVIEVQKKW